MKRHVKQKSTNLGSIRIISGQFRGRKLPVLDAQGLRPTTDRVKETLFNWLAPYIAGRRCVDAFAGSGSLGFEALSRYAAQVIFCEKNGQAAKQLEQNCQLLKLNQSVAQVCHADVLSMKLAKQSVDMLFVDPPFNQGLVTPLVEKVCDQDILADGALIYLETELSAVSHVMPSSWTLLKQRQTKQVSVRLYEYQTTKRDSE